MTDSNDQITNKIKKAKTDSMNMPINLNEAEKRPEINNLLNIYCAATNRKKDEIISNFAGKEISFFKKSLTEIIITTVEPISTKTRELLNNEKYLDDILIKGAEDARKIAQKKIQEIYKIVGMI